MPQTSGLNFLWLEQDTLELSKLQGTLYSPLFDFEFVTGHAVDPTENCNTSTCGLYCNDRT